MPKMMRALRKPAVAGTMNASMAFSRRTRTPSNRRGVSGSLARDRQPQLESEVRRHLGTRHSGQQLLRAAERTYSRWQPGSLRHVPAARASLCPSPLHPDMATSDASPRGTSVRMSSPSSQWRSWHHLDPSTPSRFLRPRITALSCPGPSA